MDTSLVQAMGFYDFRAQQYWAEWLDLLGVPSYALPVAVPTLYDYGGLCVTGPDGKTADVPVLAMIGDQQAAMLIDATDVAGAEPAFAHHLAGRLFIVEVSAHH